MHMYFLAIVLPPEIDKEVKHWKLYMQERYKCAVGLKSPAHITIVPPFWLDESKELHLRSVMDSIYSSIKSFAIESNNFSAFKPRTIFVAVKENEALNQVKKITDSAFEKYPEFRIKKEERPFHPHITIATRDLHKSSFAEAWPFFEKKEFLYSWEAEGVSLLKHNRAHWEVVFSSRFLKE